MAVYITSRIIKFDDLTVEGSFGLGGALSSQVFLFSWNPWISLPIALFGGAICGLITGLLHTQLKINNLISGLVVTTGIFSISLAMAGSNVALKEGNSILENFSPVIILIIIVLGIWIFLEILLRSELGLLLRTVGCNPQMITSLGRSIAKYKIFALMISNAMTALAGTLFVHWCGFFSITGNVGTLIIGLAGLILGETIYSKFGWSLIIGSILYQALFALTLEMQLSPVWNNLIKSGLIVLLIQLNPKQEHISIRR